MRGRSNVCGGSDLRDDRLRRRCDLEGQRHRFAASLELKRTRRGRCLPALRQLECDLTRGLCRHRSHLHFDLLRGSIGEKNGAVGEGNGDRRSHFHRALKLAAHGIDPAMNRRAIECNLRLADSNLEPRRQQRRRHRVPD